MENSNEPCLGRDKVPRSVSLPVCLLDGDVVLCLGPQIEEEEGIAVDNDAVVGVDQNQGQRHEFVQCKLELGVWIHACLILKNGQISIIHLNIEQGIKNMNQE